MKNVESGTRRSRSLRPDARTGAGAIGTPLTIDGLWALGWGGGGTRNGLSTDLYFTAGPNDENDGLFGKISPTSTEQHGNAE